MNARKALLFVTASLFLATSVFGQFEKANEEYASGRFEEAITDYEAVVQKGEYSANLFYDLGNAYFRVQDFGNAILNYERALALDRHHAEAQANLRIARDEGRALELQPDGVERFVHFASSNQLSVVAVVAFWSAMFGLVALLFAARRTSGTIGWFGMCLSIFGLCAVAVYFIETGNGGRALAIVTAKDVQARVATADSANSVLALPPGSEIKIVQERGGWVYAVLPNKLRGWIPASSAATVRP